MAVFLSALPSKTAGTSDPIHSPDARQRRFHAVTLPCGVFHAVKRISTPAFEGGSGETAGEMELTSRESRWTGGRRGSRGRSQDVTSMSETEPMSRICHDPATYSRRFIAAKGRTHLPTTALTGVPQTVPSVRGIIMWRLALPLVRRYTMARILDIMLHRMSRSSTSHVKLHAPLPIRMTCCPN